jgi:hypothetical protein
MDYNHYNKVKQYDLRMKSGQEANPPAGVSDPDLEKSIISPGGDWTDLTYGMDYLKYFLSIAYTQDSSRIESLNPVSPMSSFLYLRDRYGSYNYDKKYSYQKAR